MKIMLTGSTGFIGQHLLPRLSNVHCYKKGETFGQPDLIYHLAGQINDESKMFDTNVKLTYDLLTKTNCPLIQVSSSSVYGRKATYISEKDTLEPTNIYEATKACGDMLCLAFAKKRRIVIARPFSLYGPFDHPHRFFPTIYKHKTLLKVAKGNHDWLYIDDFIIGLLILGERGISGDIVNFGTGVSTTNLEVVKTFEKFLGKIDYEEVDSYIRDYDSNNWVADITYAKERYGFKAEYDLETGIREFIKKESTRYQ